MASAIKTQAGGETIYNFNVNVTCSSPVIVDVSPLTATRGAVTAFAAAGACIPGTAVSYIEWCENLTYTKISEAEIKWTCKVSSTAGSYNGMIKDKSGGTILKSFVVTAK